MALHQHATEFQSRNLLLHLALGLRSHGATLHTLIERYAPPDAPRLPSSPSDERLIAATLGLVALFARLEAHLQHAASRAPTAPPPLAHPVAPRGLLR